MYMFTFRGVYGGGVYVGVCMWEGVWVYQENDNDNSNNSDNDSNDDDNGNNDINNINSINNNIIMITTIGNYGKNIITIIIRKSGTMKMMIVIIIMIIITRMMTIMIIITMGIIIMKLICATGIRFRLFSCMTFTDSVYVRFARTSTSKTKNQRYCFLYDRKQFSDMSDSCSALDCNTKRDGKEINT